jgi:hypothetical protein
MTKGATGSAEAHSASSKGRRDTVRKRPKSTAPVISSTTMAEMRTLSTMDWTMPLKSRLRCTRPIARAPKAPAAPASVGVNQPM